MPRAQLAFIVALLVPACVVDSPVAEQRGTETLSERIDSFCASTCERLSGCLSETCNCVETSGSAGTGAGSGGSGPTPSSCSCTPTTNDECQAQCLATMNDIAARGSTCEEAANTLMLCFDGITSCESADETQYCANPDVLPPACIGGDGPKVDPTDPAPTGGVVVCRAGAGGGTAGRPGTDNETSFVCQQSLEDCTDGSSYSIDCEGTQASSTCTCERDGEISGAFIVAPATCPGGAVVNAMCGWHLADIL